MKSVLLVLFLAFFVQIACAQELQPIQLQKPDLTSGATLMQALSDRQSAREFSSQELSMEQLSGLLWAANGVNREKEQKHTAPSPMNVQDIDIYVILPQGIYLYDPHQWLLAPIKKGNFRAQAGKQEYVAKAPVNLIYVSDYDKFKNSDNDTKLIYSGSDAGFIAQNVYLYCAAFNLNCVVRAYIDKEKLAETLQLRPNQKIILGQTVGMK